MVTISKLVFQQLYFIKEFLEERKIVSLDSCFKLLFQKFPLRQSFIHQGVTETGLAYQADFNLTIR